MKKVLCIFFTLIITLSILTLCNNKENAQNKLDSTKMNQSNGEANDLTSKETYYLSLTASCMDNEKLYDAFLVYNPATNVSDEVYRLVATSQYALGVVDKQKETLYFVKRAVTNQKEVDQIFRMDLKTKKIEQLTTEVEAVNYLIPVGDKLFFVASRFGSYNLEFGYYDLTNKKIWFSNQFDYTDIMVESLSYNAYNNKLYATIYSLSENKNRLDDFYSKQGKDPTAYFHRPKRTVYEFDTNGIITRKLGVLDEQEVNSFVVCTDGKRAIAKSINSKDEKHQVLMFDDITKLDSYRKITDLENINAKNLYFSPDDKGIYFCAFIDESNNSGEHPSNWLLYYNFETQKIEREYALKNGYISNFTILKQ